MQANFNIKVQQGKFPAGTVGGKWRWWLVSEGASIDPVDVKWTTLESYTSKAVDDGSYNISAQRLEIDGKTGLGPIVNTSFTVDDGVEPPTHVFIDVAGSIQVTISDDEVTPV